MPEGLKDLTECGDLWSMARCQFGRNWNQTKMEIFNGYLSDTRR